MNKIKFKKLNRHRKFLNHPYGRKRGFLLAEETLKIVIAVISLIFLVYFLTSLYLAKSSENAIEKAKQVLLESDESVKNIIDNLNEGESREIGIQRISQGIDDWHLFGFTQEAKPNSCAGENCLCICDDVLEGRQAEECVKQGVCLVVEALENKKINLELDETLNFITIKKTNNEISIDVQEETEELSVTKNEEVSEIINIGGETESQDEGINPAISEGEQTSQSEETTQTEAEEENIFVATVKRVYGKIRDFFGGGKAKGTENAVIGTKGQQETGIGDDLT